MKEDKIKMNNKQYITYLDSVTTTISDSITEQLSELATNIIQLQKDVDQLRSALDAMTVKPKQKDDLEISNRIVLSEDFLKLEDNMFIS